MLKSFTVHRKTTLWVILALGMLFTTLLAGCLFGSGQEPEATPEDTPVPVPTPFEITYCDINPFDLCLEGFGLGEEDQLLILLVADDRAYTSIKTVLEWKDGDSTLECLQSQAFRENVYCQGGVVPDGEKIELNIYTLPDETLRALGAFIVHYESIQAPDVEFGVTPTITPTTTPISAIQNASQTPGTRTPMRTPTRTPTQTPRPAYPNPSYPN